MRFTANDIILQRMYRDLLFDNAPDLTVYVGAVETQTSDSTTQVTVTNTVRRVMSVWLATDSDYVGTNYYANSRVESFTGSVITLDSALPAASTDVNVAYYADCATCGWDDIGKAARDSDCATCDGLGMILALGTAETIPAKRIRFGGYTDEIGAIGVTTGGNIKLRILSEYENMIKAAIGMQYGGQDLITYGDASGDMSVDRLYNAAGQCTAVDILTRYEQIG